MSDENGKIWLTFNGEIYNYLELKQTLKSLGHVFKSGTDSEVVIHAYEEWGEDCVKKFNGMWAFAIWDENRNTLFLSRDRFGIKPLYYLMNKDFFIFASEIKAILAVCHRERLPNLNYIAIFLSYGFMDYNEETFFANIKSLPPAHSMVVTPKGISIERYWVLSPSKIPTDESSKRRDSKNLQENFFCLIDDAVKKHLVGDVPVGACLSGGLDSSTIVSLASQHAPGILTFTSTFSGDDYDESPYAFEVSKKFKTRATWIKPSVDDFMDCLSCMIWHQDEPNPAYGMFPQWKIMEQACKRVKVLLDGQGGDELLGGYHHFLPHYLQTLQEDLGKSENAFLTAQKEIEDNFGKTFAMTPQNSHEKDFHYRAAVLDNGLRRKIRWLPTDHSGPFKNHLDNVLFNSLTRDTLPALLHCEDRMSMAFSVESRVPFLDHRLVEFCFTLPYYEKISNGITKVILRKAMRDILPESVLMRKDKLGFPAPLSTWIRDDLRDPIQDYLFSEKFGGRGIFNQATIRKRFESHIRGAADHTWEIWRWLSLEIWFREFIDRKIGTEERHQ